MLLNLVGLPQVSNALYFVTCMLLNLVGLPQAALGSELNQRRSINCPRVQPSKAADTAAMSEIAHYCIKCIYRS
jgi:hypothetical protein